ncbi:hypothetical protein E2C01_040178 [Portunus trituberculatus]|uniref:Uncharacterized protein n=1 Tax=Portunus trituberculatus TaxID=210409 RepID=A0A5B7FNA0_PORTR|nr:hypothetical protein [Portunus trituberculatus]
MYGDNRKCNDCRADLSKRPLQGRTPQGAPLRVHPLGRSPDYRSQGAPSRHSLQSPPSRNMRDRGGQSNSPSLGGKRQQRGRHRATNFES